MDRRAWTLMWTLALLWGASYLFIRLGLDGGMEPVFLVFARVALAAAVLLAVAARAGALRGLSAHARPLTVLAVVQVVVPFMLITTGEERIPSSLVGILVATAPIFTALLVFAGIGSEARATRWGAAGIGIGLVGVVLLFGADLTGSADTLIGGGMVVLAALGYAAGALYLRRSLLGVPSVAVAAGSMAVSALATLPFALLALPPAVPPVGALAAVAALGVLGTGAAFLIFYTLISEIGAGRASVVAYLAPAFALLYGAVLLGEPVTAGALGGLALILLGSWLAAAQRAPWRRPPGPPAPVAAPAAEPAAAAATA